MSKSLVQSQFGAHAGNYATSLVHAKGASLGRLVELVKPASSWRMLDIATGAGHTALAFAPHVTHVIASDITPEMLSEAAKLAAQKGFKNLETATADAEALPFDDASFDLVTCRIAPHHFPSIPQFVAEAWRVLKSSGVFAVVDNVAPDAMTTPGFSRDDLRHADQTYNAFEKLRDPSHGRALTTAEWIEIVSDAGFEIAHQEHQPKAMVFATWCTTMAVPAETVPKLAAMLRETRPALAAFLKPSEADGQLGFVLREFILIGRKVA